MLISVVGPSGVGKTTFVRALQRARDFVVAYEQHAERPFQALFKKDKKYALANQLDYLLYRAEQERELRQSPKTGLVDGGLDLDFHGFTRLFRARGWLTAAEFDLCRRLYQQARAFLPPPELIVHLNADAETIRLRLAARTRINIASAEDAQLLERLLSKWLANIRPDKILRLDVSSEGVDFEKSIALLINKLDGKLFIRAAHWMDDDGCSVCVSEAFNKYVERMGKRPAPMLLNFPAFIGAGSVWVAEQREKIAGVLVAYPEKKDFYVDALAVSPPHQGAGIGRALLEFAEAEAQRRGLNSVYLCTNVKMTENHTFYPHLGYVEYDRRTEDGYDRIYYRKQIT